MSQQSKPTVAMRIAVVGAGPAGVTAAHHLQGAGHRVTVLERTDVVGGRTHTEHLGDGHWLDTGAGWLASFYPDTLALLDELGLRDRLLRPLSLRGGGDLLLDGRLVPAPNSVAPDRAARRSSVLVTRPASSPTSPGSSPASPATCACAGATTP